MSREVTEISGSPEPEASSSKETSRRARLHEALGSLGMNAQDMDQMIDKDHYDPNQDKEERRKIRLDYRKLIKTAEGNIERVEKK